MIEIVCPVRGCKRPLAREEHQWSCPEGHSFDVARSGYCNLLQPDQRRSKNPGDSVASARSRRALFERGIGHRFLDDIGGLLEELDTSEPILDAGCGEGFYLAGICKRFGIEGVGIDISTPSIDLAARAHRSLTWIVSNIDREIPLADRSIGAVLSITSRVNHAEFERVLIDGGLLIVAVPGTDDLAELRANILGEGLPLSRSPDSSPGSEGPFELVRQLDSREVIDADRETIDALLLATYRGQRRSQGPAVAATSSMKITHSRQIAVYRKRT